MFYTEQTNRDNTNPTTMEHLVKFELDFLRNLHTSYRLLANNATRRVKTLGLTLAQAMMLHYLARCPDDSLEDIARQLRMAKSAARQTLHQLLAADYLSRQPDANDKRLYHFSLREKGLQILPQIIALGNDFVHQTLAGLTEYERDTFVELLEKLKQHIIDNFATKGLSEEPDNLSPCKADF